jgi:hypothetical protein
MGVSHSLLVIVHWMPPSFLPLASRSGEDGSIRFRRHPFILDNVQRFSFGGAAAQTSPRGFRSWDPRR